MANKADELRLIRTKLNRPRVVDDLVARPALFALLGKKLEKPLTLVVAPAGYGKTTVVASWLTAHPCKSCWLSLDEHDSDLGVFLAYLTAAIRQAYPGSCCETALLLDAASPPSLQVIASSLIDDLILLPGPIVIVLDDYHTIREQAIHEMLDLVLRYAPDSLRLVIISRRDPLLPLARMRAQGRLTEMRAQQLRFSQAEVAALVKLSAKQDVDDAAVRALEERTEGWITGLRLAILSAQNKAGRDSDGVGIPRHDRYMADYLMSEVFQQQAGDIQAFLIKTSIVDRFSVPLCEALLAHEKPAGELHAFLTSTRSANLFIVPLDSEGRWFRYHHLLRQFIQDQARRRLSTSEIASLHCRAAAWFSNEGLIEEALRHFLAAGAYGDAVRLLAKHRHTFMSQGYWSGIRRYLEMVPGEIIDQEPELLIQSAWIRRIQWRSASMRPVLERAETLLEQAALGENRARSLHGEIDALKATLSLTSGTARDAIVLLENAVKAVDPHHSYVRGYATMLLANAYQVNGQGDDAAALLSNALLDTPSDTQLQLRLWSALGLIHYLEADLDNAWLAGTRYNEISHGRAEEDGMKWGEYRLACVSYFRNDLSAAARSFSACTDRPRAVHSMTTTNVAIGLAMTYQAQAKPEQAREIAERNVTVLEGLGHIGLLPLAEAFRAELAAVQGRLAEAQSWLPYASTVPMYQEYIGFYAPQLALPKILLIENTPKSRTRACAVLADLRELIEQRHNKRFLIEVLVLQALAHKACGNISLARDALLQAVNLSEPGRFLRPFMDLGPGMLPLLVQLPGSDGSNAYVTQIIDACRASRPTNGRGKAVQGQPPYTHATHPDLIESLTNRELDVLMRLDERLTNKEIAQELGISSETVKQHTINLYRKLHVNNRRQAANAARAMGIL